MPQPNRRRNLFGVRRNASVSNAVKPSVLSRSASVPNFVPRTPSKSVLRVGSQDDSLLKEGLTRTHSGVSDDKSTIERESKVKFDKVVVRDYARTVGDNPAVSFGPPISISWQYIENEGINLDDFENGRGKRRIPSEMVVSRQDRFSVLMKEWGIPRAEVTGALVAAGKIKAQRRQTLVSLNSGQSDECLETFGMKLKNVFGGKNNKKGGLSDSDIEAMMAQMAAAGGKSKGTSEPLVCEERQTTNTERLSFPSSQVAASG